METFFDCCDCEHPESIEVFAFGEDGEYQYSIPEAEGLVRLPDFTVDSGAGCSVGKPSDFPFAEVVPSDGSRKGQMFVGAQAGSAGIPNLGQMNLNLVTEPGDEGAMCIQAADVRKPLLAVSSVNRKGNPVWFDGERSYILPSTARNLAPIRKLIQEIENKIPLHLSNGTYKMKAWRRASPFQGRGR